MKLYGSATYTLSSAICNIHTIALDTHPKRYIIVIYGKNKIDKKRQEKGTFL